MEAIFWVMWGVLFAGVITGLTVWLILRAHPYKIRIREITTTNVRLICDTLARVKRNTEKVEYLGLLSARGGHNKLPLPPPEAIDYDNNKRKKVVECYYSEETGYIYIKDGGRIEGFQALTTKQRQMLVNEIHKKESRKQNSWKQNIPLIVGVGFVVMLVAIVMIFAPDVIKEFGNLVGQLDSVTEKVGNLLDKASIIESGQQVITDTPPPI